MVWDMICMVRIVVHPARCLMVSDMICMALDRNFMVLDKILWF